MQTAQLLFFLAGVFVVVAVSIRYAQAVANIESQGGVVDGDVRRGPFIAIAAGLVTAALGACSFLLLRNGHRWACWLSVLVWFVLWFPAVINVSVYMPGFAGPVVVTLACMAGSVFSTAAFFLLDPNRSRAASVSRRLAR
jgi:hypothetical protein